MMRRRSRRTDQKAFHGFGGRPEWVVAPLLLVAIGAKHGKCACPTES